MSIVIRSPPIRTRSKFILHPSFQVHIRLKDPIIWNHTVSSQAPTKAKIVSVCAKLEVLLEKELETRAADPPDGELFDREPGNLLIFSLSNQLAELAETLAPRKDLKWYLDESGLSSMFPAVAMKFCAPEDVVTTDLAEEYFNAMTIMNQLTTMSKQLASDAKNLTNHKYMAHQIALLYQILNQAGESGVPFKKRIEPMFERIKSITEAQKQPQLSPDMIEWLQQLAEELFAEVASFQSSRMHKVSPLLWYLRNPR
eukprot:TRINITY_DN27367_c0_g1_i1.p1 TRINITY_DN27367_c0_g1~~TRINITY_DN27367_c0_g1_i1.p1  ORF type:complete len:256 (+),score=32.14 TRINITY_DN27367_c0_g1_i1:150-917(+)